MKVGIPGPRLPTWVQTVSYGFRPVEFLLWCHRRYGDMFRIRLPGGGIVMVVADPAAIGEIMSLGADEFTAAAAAPLLEPFLGSRSLLLLDGERHKSERRLLVEALHGDTMSSYSDVMVAATERDMKTWPVGRPFALHPRLQAITLDVIVEVIFGADGEQARGELVEVLRPWLRQGNSLLLLWEPLRREVGGHSPWARFLARRERIDRVLNGHIAGRRQDPHLSERKDVLSILLSRGDEFDGLSLRDQLMTMLAAGHDTSATALGWAFALLLRHPPVLDRLLAEIDAGEDAYLDATVKEVLRLTPVVLEVGRTLTHDTTIGGQAIPAGASVMPSVLLAQRRPDRYPAPLEFRPERFLDQPADPHTWLPFGGGIRRCIGAAFATLEIKTVLRTVLSNVELRAVGPMERPRRRAVTMIPSRGTRVIMTRARVATADRRHTRVIS